MASDLVERTATKSDTEADRTIGYAVARYVAAFLLLLYGFAKITGAQFTVLDSELDKPLGEVSGFWLTWYYFGFSPVYGTVVALVQVGGAIALMVRRTALLAACALLPVVGNILLINVFYAIGLSPLVVASVILCCLLAVMRAHRQRLLQLLLPAHPERSRATSALKWAVRAALVLFPLAFTYYVANYNNRHPTPIDGTWIVASASLSEPAQPTHVYFERNRAHMCVFRYEHGSSTHHFEIDRGLVRIWTHWLMKGPLLLEGTYDPSAKTIALRGRAPGTLRPVTFQLTKVRPPRTAG
ncbi:MAG TPA: hypothetical protein VF432_02695 [Thermoanaerobaculia bacterium]